MATAATLTRKTSDVRVGGLIAELEQKLQSLRAASGVKVILPELHDAASGRIDAQRVADFMGIPLKRLCEGLGLNYKSVHRAPSAEPFQKALRPVKRSLEILHEFFPRPATIRIWLNTAHPDLDGKTALEAILENHARSVWRILENAAAGVPV